MRRVLPSARTHPCKGVTGVAIMGNAVRTRLIKIGNSRGIRLPKTLLEQARLEQEVEIEAQDGQLVIRPVTHPRAEWDAMFRKMAARGDDRLLDADAPATTEWDETEWQW